MKKNLVDKSFEEVKKEFSIKPPSEKQTKEFLWRKGRRGMKILTAEKVKRNRRNVDRFFRKLESRCPKCGAKIGGKR
jgi:hypothetical protein